MWELFVEVLEQPNTGVSVLPKNIASCLQCRRCAIDLCPIAVYTLIIGPREGPSPND
jgi:hypothetical protein